MNNEDGITIESTVLEHIKHEDTSGPYLLETITTKVTTGRYNPDFGDDKSCDCGHAYYRHFDSYENNSAVGCKYCDCCVWEKPAKKAGLIPYFVNENGIILMQFMISSDPHYGGPDPQIAKGHVDPEDEGSFAAALREAGEELGLKASNLLIHDDPSYKCDNFDHVVNIRAGELCTFSGTHNGSDGEYTFKLYAFPVKNIVDFDTPCFETAYTRWMTAKEFADQGRDIQKKLVENTVEMITKDIERRSKRNKYSM